MKKDITTQGFVATQSSFGLEEIRLQYTSDGVGKTLSIGNDEIQFTMPFEAIEELTKGDNNES